jgi:hypothetical protein
MFWVSSLETIFAGLTAAQQQQQQQQMLDIDR